MIGKPGTNIPQSSALQHVAGYCLALDMTNRPLQGALKKKGLPWTLAKGFDTACPVSDFIPAEKIPNPEKQGIWLKVNSPNIHLGRPRLLGYHYCQDLEVE